MYINVLLCYIWKKYNSIKFAYLRKRIAEGFLGFFLSTYLLVRG